MSNQNSVSDKSMEIVDIPSDGDEYTCDTYMDRGKININCNSSEEVKKNIEKLKEVDKQIKDVVAKSAKDGIEAVSSKVPDVEDDAIDSINESLKKYAKGTSSIVHKCVDGQIVLDVPPSATVGLCNTYVTPDVDTAIETSSLKDHIIPTSTISSTSSDSDDDFVAHTNERKTRLCKLMHEYRTRHDDNMYKRDVPSIHIHERVIDYDSEIAEDVSVITHDEHKSAIINKPNPKLLLTKDEVSILDKYLNTGNCDIPKPKPIDVPYNFTCAEPEEIGCVINEDELTLHSTEPIHSTGTPRLKIHIPDSTTVPPCLDTNTSKPKYDIFGNREYTKFPLSEVDQRQANMKSLIASAYDRMYEHFKVKIIKDYYTHFLDTKNIELHYPDTIKDTDLDINAINKFNIYRSCKSAKSVNNDFMFLNHSSDPKVLKYAIFIIDVEKFDKRLLMLNVFNAIQSIVIYGNTRIIVSFNVTGPYESVSNDLKGFIGELNELQTKIYKLKLETDKKYENQIPEYLVDEIDGTIRMDSFFDKFSMFDSAVNVAFKGLSNENSYTNEHQTLLRSYLLEHNVIVDSKESLVCSFMCSDFDILNNEILKDAGHVWMLEQCYVQKWEFEKEHFRSWDIIPTKSYVWNHRCNPTRFDLD